MDRRAFIFTSLAVALPSGALSQTSLEPGQLLITGFRGVKLGDPEVDRVCHMLEYNLCAGVILLRRNCTSPEQISKLSWAFRDAAGGLTPVISIDQEGGRVARLDSGNGFFDWMSAKSIADSEMSPAEIEAYWTKRAWQLSEVGINLNYAPVVDLDLNHNNPIISKLGRSFGVEADFVSRMATLFIQAHRSAGVKTSLKHFPGHGSSTTDSHNETADISDSWKKAEMEPFSNIVHADLADGIMNGHLLHPRYSDEPWLPSSLSWRSVREIRKTLGFKGAIITDDMQMAAIEDLMPLEDSAVAAVNAGNTFLIYSNYRQSDHINTVERVAASLRDNMGQMDPNSVAEQIALARDFRSKLR